ncbi:phosphatidylethanolamine-binding protein [Biscogniauxia mediterranea]|nr:phosphatidylethanolamine-binding protein [Biscogniauxia mediterranea]
MKGPTNAVAAMLLLFAGLSGAQTPEGFEPAVEAKLDITFGTKAVETPGTALTKAETAQQPTIAFSGAAADKSYLWMMIDIDASTNFANPSAGQPSTYLHTVLRDFTLTTDTTEGTLTTTASGPVSWFAPAPAAEVPPHPHRYTNLLWEQPASWGEGGGVPAAAGAMLQSQKLGFDVPAFVEAAGLGAPVAANYFNVSG